MKSTVLIGLLRNAVILAESLEHDRLEHTVKYLNDNGVNASEHQVRQFLIRKWVPLLSKTEEAELIELADVIDKLVEPVKHMLNKYDWLGIAKQFIGNAYVTAEQLADVLQDTYNKGCDDTLEVSNEFHEDN